MKNSVLISKAMSLLGSRRTDKKTLSSIANLEAARASGKKGGWPKGRPRKKVK